MNGIGKVRRRCFTFLGLLKTLIDQVHRSGAQRSVGQLADLVHILIDGHRGFLNGRQSGQTSSTIIGHDDRWRVWWRWRFLGRWWAQSARLSVVLSIENGDVLLQLGQGHVLGIGEGLDCGLLTFTRRRRKCGNLDKIVTFSGVLDRRTHVLLLTTGSIGHPVHRFAVVVSGRLDHHLTVFQEHHVLGLGIACVVEHFPTLTLNIDRSSLLWLPVVSCLFIYFFSLCLFCLKGADCKTTQFIIALLGNRSQMCNYKGRF